MIKWLSPEVLIMVIFIAVFVPTLNSPSIVEGQITEWKTYSNSNYGFSVEYPSTWSVFEKSNRFEPGSFVNISDYSYPIANVFTLGNFILHSPYSDIHSLNEQLNLFALVPGVEIIEGSSMSKYTIDGEPAGTFMIAYKDPNSLSNVYKVVESIATLHNDNMYVFGFSGASSFYDNASNAEIRTHILNSIKWLQ